MAQEPDIPDFLRRALRDPAGLAFFRLLILDTCRTYVSPFAETERETNMLIGRQAIGFDVAAMLIQADHTALTTLMKETD